jgi:hypothetical protein
MVAAAAMREEALEEECRLGVMGPTVLLLVQVRNIINFYCFIRD